jgi:hypothetical protein
MSWNYRIVVREEGQFLHYGIYEVYYEEDGETIRFVSAEPVDPWGDTFEELKDNMHQMAEAFHRPTVDWDHAWDES